ncbi:twin-arginine translocase subunit TatC [Haloglycomyces albus]|uniref:twin-arginine translocase subunit TatC n=1 Tax=Haloglycomyces albus TaxID=526067 RepID=UPI0004AD0A27|nr:twin-arginine translocase subunit TatC [Haloglycomyces albus]
MEHIQDFRRRLLGAVLAILVGTAVGMYFAQDVITFLSQPYCEVKSDLSDDEASLCQFNLGSPIDHITIWLKISLYLGLIATAPVWLYQLWAFLAPGLHRNERKYAYAFIAIATPLFLGGVVLAYFVVKHGLQFIMILNGAFDITIDLQKYIGFYVAVMLVFGLGFEFPLIMLMLNVIGVISAKRMLGWWRIVVFMSFLFTAVFTPTPDPFGMTALAICMLILYLMACGVAFINDRRRAARDEQWDDDEASDIGTADPVAPSQESTPESDLNEQSDESEDGSNVRRNRLGRPIDFDDIT